MERSIGQNPEEEVYETPDVPEETTEPRQPLPTHEDVVSETLHPEQAFEVFMGKKFDARQQGSLQRKVGDSLAPPRTRFTGTGVKNLPVSRRIGRENEVETSLARFERLQREVEEMREELKMLSEMEKAHKTFDEGLKVTTDEMESGLASLQEQIMSLRSDPAYSSYIGGEVVIGGTTATQRSLTENLFEQLKALRVEDESELPREKVDYELYLQSRRGDGTSKDALKVSNIESRLAALEKLVQPFADPSTTDSWLLPQQSGIVEKLQTLEKRLEQLDENHVKTQMVKVSEARKEMEDLKALKKKQDRLLGPDGSSDRRMVQQLYEKTQDWDGLAEGIPPLVERLRTLATLHEEAVSFSNEIKELGNKQGSLESLLKQDLTLLNKMSAGLEQNMETMRANIENVDRRIEALVAKTGTT